MKSNEDKKIELSENVKQELYEVLNQIKEILKDNPDFYNKLVKKCISVGTNFIYSSEITQMLEKEYPALYQYEEGIKLGQAAHLLAREVCLDTDSTRQIKIDNSIEYALLFRNEIQNEVIHFLKEEVSVIGFANNED